MIHGKVNANLFPSNIRFYIILMHDGVYCDLHYGASKAKSHYKHAHNIYISSMNLLLFRTSNFDGEFEYCILKLYIS